MRAHITAHAVERYQLRWRRDLDERDAATELAVLVASARPMRSKSLKDHEVWINGDIRLVIKRDGPGHPPSVVTVLPPRGELATESVAPSPADPNSAYLEAAGRVSRASQLVEDMKQAVVDVQSDLDRARGQLATERGQLRVLERQKVSGDR